MKKSSIITASAIIAAIYSCDIASVPTGEAVSSTNDTTIVDSTAVSVDTIAVDTVK